MPSDDNIINNNNNESQLDLSSKNIIFSIKIFIKKKSLFNFC